MGNSSFMFNKLRWKGMLTKGVREVYLTDSWCDILTWKYIQRDLFWGPSQLRTSTRACEKNRWKPGNADVDLTVHACRKMQCLAPLKMIEKTLQWKWKRFERSKCEVSTFTTRNSCLSRLRPRIIQNQGSILIIHNCSYPSEALV